MRTSGAIVAVLLTASFAIGDDGPIAQRRLIMSKMQRAEVTANNVILGKFFPEKAVAAMKTMEDNLTVFPTLFPESGGQGETKASPEIWKNMDDFKSLAAKLVGDAKKAEGAAASGQNAFMLAFAEVKKDCDACHAKYMAGDRRL
jgi:cytochrome c556